MNGEPGVWRADSSHATRPPSSVGARLRANPEGCAAGALAAPHTRHTRVTRPTEIETEPAERQQINLLPCPRRRRRSASRPPAIDPETPGTAQPERDDLCPGSLHRDERVARREDGAESVAKALPRGELALESAVRQITPRTPLCPSTRKSLEREPRRIPRAASPAIRGPSHTLVAALAPANTSCTVSDHGTPSSPRSTSEKRRSLST